MNAKPTSTTPTGAAGMAPVAKTTGTTPPIPPVPPAAAPAEPAFMALPEELALLFKGHLEGDANRPALVISTTTLPDPARKAIENSFEAFGYRLPNASFATLESCESPQTNSTSPLDKGALFLLIESLDPRNLIVTDSDCISCLEEAYRTQLPRQQAESVRILGRQAAVFTNFVDLLTNEEGKQLAWRILKTLKDY